MKTSFATLKWGFTVFALNHNTPQDELNQTTYSIPDVVPFVRYGGRPADPSWSAAFPQLVWSLVRGLTVDVIMLWFLIGAVSSTTTSASSLLHKSTTRACWTICRTLPRRWRLLAVWSTGPRRTVTGFRQTTTSKSPVRYHADGVILHTCCLGPFTSAYSYLNNINQVLVCAHAEPATHTVQIAQIAESLGQYADMQALEQVCGSCIINVLNTCLSSSTPKLPPSSTPPSSRTKTTPMRSRSRIINAMPQRFHSSCHQIAMALPLLLGIVPESLNQTALFETLISNIVDVNLYHVTTVLPSIP